VSWRTMNKNTLRYIAQPGGRDWWDRVGDQWFEHEFVEYVNAQLKRDCK
jgi:hypothetical protein